MKIIWEECQKSVNLQRVFHGIRFILRLVKIACREISNFFVRVHRHSRRSTLTFVFASYKKQRTLKIDN